MSGAGTITPGAGDALSRPAPAEIAAVEGEVPAGGEGAAEKKSLLKAAAERERELAELLRRAGGAAGTGGAAAASGGEKPGAAPSLDADFVHDLRVASRRLEEAAGLLAALMDKASTRVVKASLKTLRRAAGDLRDLDVACEHLKGTGKWRIPAKVRTIARKLADDMRNKRGGLETKLRGAAGSSSVLGAMVMLARVIEDHGAAAKKEETEEKLRRELDKRSGRREKKLRETFGKAALKQTPECLHAARIAAKKLRYVLELADAGGVAREKSRLKSLKGIQKLLGEHHDVHVVEEMLGDKVAGEKEKGVAAEWRSWKKRKEREQAERAAEFFVRSYAWMNRGR